MAASHGGAREALTPAGGVWYKQGMAQSSAATADRASTRHPKGLYLLFTTEMWERTSFYGMRALLTLYLVDKARGGLGLTPKEALNLYAWYGGLVYATPLLGGWLADRFLGQRRAIMIGGFLMMMGQFTLALPGLATFYGGLGLLIAGNGLFKPNISTIVGGLYQPKDPRRDSGFTIFYMGINVGATLGAVGCGYLGERIGWGWGYASAGVGMMLGLVSFALLGKRLLGDVGLSPNRSAAVKVEAEKESRHPLTRQEVERIIVLLVIILFAALFWAAYEQAGGLMNLYAEQKTDRVMFGWEVPASWFQAVNSIFIIMFSPVFAKLWLWLSARNKDPSSVVKMGMGLLLLGGGFVLMVAAARQNALGMKSSAALLILTYMLHTFGELCLSPVGLSLTTKLAPKHLASRLMGVWFLSNALGNYAAGKIGGLASDYGDLTVFAGLAIAAVSGGLLLLLLSGVLKRMTHGADEVKRMEDLANESTKPQAAASAAG